MSAFTAAFQVPNLVRSLFADSALSAAFVPVFTELLEHDKRKDALQLAAALFGLILAVADRDHGAVHRRRRADHAALHRRTRALDDLTVGLSRVLFPIVILLGLNGLLVGDAQRPRPLHDPGALPAGLEPRDHRRARSRSRRCSRATTASTRTRSGSWLGTAGQFAMAFPVLQRLDIPIRISFSWRDPRIRRVLLLMLPVTIGLGLINFNLLINTYFGFRISEEAPAAIDSAFRIYMLPQGMFSVAVATVLFPALSRFVARQDWDGLRRTQGNGMRQIALLLIPAAAATIAIPEPITRLVYERGEFDAESTRQVVRGAVLVLVLAAVLRLQPAAHPHVLLAPEALDADRAGRRHARHQCRRVGGALRAARDRRRRARHGGRHRGDDDRAGRVPAPAHARARAGHHARGHGARSSLASAVLGGVAYATWWVLDELLGRSLPAQIASVGGALTLGSAAYAALVLAMRHPGGPADPRAAHEPPSSLSIASSLVTVVQLRAVPSFGPRRESSAASLLRPRPFGVCM